MSPVFRRAMMIVRRRLVRGAGVKIQRRTFAAMGKPQLPKVENEPMLNYAVGSPERQLLKEALAKARSECPDVPCIVGGKEIRTGDVATQVVCSDHRHQLCTYHRATPDVVQSAVKASLDAKPMWESMPIEDRLAIFTKASWLLSKVYRYELMASVMLGTGKNPWQAEIDAAAELVDFWRFGAKFVEEMYGSQVTHHDDGVWNRLEYRPLEGFALAITPFNFAAIGGNLPSTPAMVGNTVVWKPASSAILSNYRTYEILVAAGLPDGVINFIPSSGAVVSEYVLSDPALAAVTFTGSTAVFRSIWKQIGTNIDKYRSYPRIVGETGGKNFHVVHPSADVDHVVNSTIRGAFEYQGQKCSATSRMYAPRSLWGEMKEKLVTQVKQIKVGQPDDFDNFMTAVIDRNAWNDHVGYIQHCESDPDCQIIVGGQYDDSEGFFISPTIVETTNPHSKTMKEEIFGPVLTVYVYDDDKFDEALHLADTTSEYALTGSIFAQDRMAVVKATEKLRHSAGNFYINDKSTGAVVGQQPFGGARASGTNDKAGWTSIYGRFCSLRAIKENMVPTTDWRYPHMAQP